MKPLRRRRRRRRGGQRSLKLEKGDQGTPYKSVFYCPLCFTPSLTFAVKASNFLKRLWHHLCRTVLVKRTSLLQQKGKRLMTCGTGIKEGERKGERVRESVRECEWNGGNKDVTMAFIPLRTHCQSFPDSHNKTFRINPNPTFMSKSEHNLGPPVNALAYYIKPGMSTIAIWEQMNKTERDEKWD